MKTKPIEKADAEEVADILAKGDLFITIHNNWVISKVAGIGGGVFVAKVQNYDKGYFDEQEVKFKIVPV